MFDNDLEKILQSAIGHKVAIDTDGPGDRIIGVLTKVTKDIIEVKGLVGTIYVNRKAGQILEIHDYDA